MLRATISILLLLTASAFAQDREAALNSRIAADFEQRTTRVESAPVREYVEQVGNRLAPAFSGIVFSFETVSDQVGGRTHEPVALPGGQIFVPASLLLAARDTAEVAGMLAHAMAHAAAGHSLIRQPGTTGSLIAANLSTIGGDPLLPVSLLPEYRQHELDADRTAVRVMAAAGYDPEALARYIRRVQLEGERLYSALPPPEIRLAELQQATESLPVRPYESDSALAAAQQELRQANPPSKPPSLYRGSR
jgi:predicted Zn-dependent protease